MLITLQAALPKCILPPEAREFRFQAFTTDAVSRRALAGIFPSDQLLIDKELLGPYESDGLTAFAVTPSAVVIPKTRGSYRNCPDLCSAQGSFRLSKR